MCGVVRGVRARKTNNEKNHIEIFFPLLELWEKSPWSVRSFSILQGEEMESLAPESEPGVSGANCHGDGEREQIVEKVRERERRLAATHGYP